METPPVSNSLFGAFVETDLDPVAGVSQPCGSNVAKPQKNFDSSTIDQHKNSKSNKSSDSKRTENSRIQVCFCAACCGITACGCAILGCISTICSCIFAPFKALFNFCKK